MTDQERVLVVGQVIAGATCSNWDVAALPNAVDFTIAVLDLTTFPKPCEYLTTSQLGQFNNLLQRLLASGGRVFVFLPKSNQSLTLRVAHPLGHQVEFAPAMVIPVPYSSTPESGTTVVNVVPEYTWYLSKLKQWMCHFVLQPPQHVPQSGDIWQFQALAQNREGRAIAGQIKVTGNGTLVVLPSIEGFDTRSAIEQLLSRVAPLSGSVPPPPWSTNLLLPGHPNLLDKVSKIDEQVRTLSDARAVLDSEIKALEAWRGLTYLSGTSLERLVSHALTMLGAIVKPEKIGNEEYLLTLDNRECIAEVKGVVGSAGLTQARQLIGHILDAEVADGIRRKGILIVTTWRETDPTARVSGKDVDFPANVIDFAQKNNIALISGYQLFRAVSKALEDSSQKGSIRDCIFSTSGVLTF
jgi:hypothetical protein